MPLVLVIEDNTLVAEVVRYALAAAGYDVQTASDGPAGLAVADEMGPDAVVLDLGLPGMDGKQVLRALKARQPELPVFIFTVHGDFPEKVDLPEADGCFVKSADLTPLIGAIDEALNGADRAASQP